MSLVIHWFRQDLRLSDNPALVEAASTGNVLPIYILDDSNAGQHQMGAASRVWLHHSLHSLNESLGGKLAIFKGDAKMILPQIAKESGATAVYWNRCYEPWRIERDTEIKASLQKNGIAVNTYNGSLLWEPWTVLTDKSEPYKVFTPYYKKAYRLSHLIREPLPPPATLTLADHLSQSIDSLKLLPDIRWDNPMISSWQVSEKGAENRLHQFLEHGMDDYKEGRNFPAKHHTSRLSPYMHFGQLSPNQIWHAVRLSGTDNNRENFCTELGWREFSYHLLYYFPKLPTDNLQPKFNHFPWKNDPHLLQCWQKGVTGYPIVDAGMRELWQTGFMHNRVRMIVGSFLVKNLLIHWHEGEQWFWDCLVDADLASNSASWQWVAGCGTDAAPYFRVFNPILQGERFDAAGAYTRTYVPELAKLPDKYLFCPWEAPEAVLNHAGVILGKTYPMPVVDVSHSRNEALAAYKKIKLSPPNDL